MTLAQQRAFLFLVAMLPLLLLVTAVSLNVGATGVHLTALWQGDTPGNGYADRIVLTQIRGPRVVMAGLTGAALAVAGAVMQGLFRNPLADPGLIGVSSGAALATACMIVLGGAGLDVAGAGIHAFITGSAWFVPIAGTLGSFAAAWLLYRFATRGGMTSVSMILLAGVALGAFAGALTGILIFRANDTALRDLTFWTMGSFAGATWSRIGILCPFLLVAVWITAGLATPLNALLLGENDARLMGYPVERIKRLAMLLVACSVGPTVSFVGAIGFVGVVVPHLIRLVTGPDHRLVLPGSALLGAALLIAADTLARIIAMPADVPVGIVTAVLGTPVFVWLLTRAHEREVPA
ncbi:heme ABC transporter permease [Acetobacter cibinongensis]|uniref:ABC transporter ferrichrome Fe3+-siderophore transporter n=1 Tax=Acetobacter cibinongensis TaxID=146475 RepID=A0A0D6N0M8_9PROT|nr:iron ABC transporter permease [Acetobacter cibinongensis]GAN59076.1 ABC transporter ferrichrome Fe3+-siderophore transporter [Acetobacter cibinongensis]GBQ19654.1 ferrichrome Fe3+-siderophore transporter permease protein FecCD [Acetobacter cibinongensis NRIC 0482]GEL58940.1 heme ABC transporter permease [Acetobacter cibinongensis]